MSPGIETESEQSRAPMAFQDHILPGVSRTFALTIPTLPDALRVPVTNAYLLCRIADTIEDDAGLSANEKQEFGRGFVEVVRGNADSRAFAGALAPRLAPSALAAERELIAGTDRVVAVTHSLPGEQREALALCVEKMSAGMHKYERRAGLEGLASQAEMDEYCYFVAGVVGEMLTALFCCHSPAIEMQRERLMRLAPSFGQGLQMTNILKDIWDDRERNTCWLPRSRFRIEAELSGDLVFQAGSEEFRRGLEGLIGRAHGHLYDALDYTLTIPREEKGIRRFCLWALGMAVLTLRKVHRNPGFRSGAEVKISRRTVGLVVGAGRAFAGHDRVLRALFRACSLGLPHEQSPLAGDARWPLVSLDESVSGTGMGRSIKTG